MHERLQGKVALITGAGRGLGKAIALAYAREGATVALAGRTVGHLTEAAHDCGPNASTHVFDACDPASIGAMTTAAIERHGQIDVLVNNAGIGMAFPTTELSLEDWRRVIDTNLTGPFLCAQAVGKHMLARGAGRIINIASISGLTGLPMRAAYGASKGGLIALTRSLAVEWGPHGVQVNAIAPGFIRTALQDDLVRRGLFPMDQIAHRTPLRRLGRPEDVASAAVFLAGPEAEWVNGETFVVDGGWLANGWVDG